MKLFSYIVANDYGLSPNPFWDRMTMALSKPAIRRAAEVGDWIIGTGSKSVTDFNGNKKNLAGSLVFAMKVDEKMTMKEYDTYCRNEKSDMRYKRPHDHLFVKDWKHKVGDCIYDFSDETKALPRIRKVMHTEDNMSTDLSGENVLISDHFYYFGSSAVKIQNDNLIAIVKSEQGNLKVEDNEVIEDFLNWLTTNFEENKLYGSPQLYQDIDGEIKRKKFGHKSKLEKA